MTNHQVHLHVRPAGAAPFVSLPDSVVLIGRDEIAAVLFVHASAADLSGLDRALAVVVDVLYGSGKGGIDDAMAGQLLDHKTEGAQPGDNRAACQRWADQIVAAATSGEQR